MSEHRPPALGHLVLVREWADGKPSDPEPGIVCAVHSDTVCDVHVLGYRARVVTSAGRNEDMMIDGVTWERPQSSA